MPGRLVHFEIPAEDIDRAQSFYEQLFGWSFQAATSFPYRMTQAGGEPAGAIYRNEGRKPGVIVYFDVEDVDAHVARVRELGGRADDKVPIPGIGWMAKCFDPDGNEVRAFQADDSVPHPESK
ncbi:MAG TPA: VOC family protein [Gaiellaceae bacterium]|jgi:predicted enzyme related to lactoylglutathione lyase|nr:VOC family protein [Gaiellaceae bacterium]